jgi:predicted DNA-binding transcriptional regulator YafY
MDRTERFYRIRRLLVEKGSLTRRQVEEELEVSHSTFKRDIEYMRDRLNVPILWSAERQAYVLDPEAEAEELPGVWFTPAEVYALLEIEHLLGQLEPGLLGRQLEPLRARLSQAIDAGDAGHHEIRRRIKVLPMGTRRVDRDVFETLSVALLNRRRLEIRHLRRASGQESVRVVSPQRLVHYRYNWYLDAWCHGREDIRTFAVDAVREARVLDEVAVDLPDERLDRVLRAGYGIFAGEATETAVLRFSGARGRWVADEVWHSRQSGRLEPDGSYLLELPYSQSPELVMDILRYGADVEVLAPAALRIEVAAELARAAARYGAAPVSAPAAG